MAVRRGLVLGVVILNVIVHVTVVLTLFIVHASSRSKYSTLPRYLTRRHGSNSSVINKI
jgi:hypothetical protein